ncbi:hypothetical protein [Nocardia wallacei]|uniref:hypothetical protein n=1 Tax=Nocardia wallacei TaxID=480035 RepID=UPI0024541402|nr:hypothetical protein [Nocardia wallacei]
MSAPCSEPPLFEAAPCRFEPICGAWVLIEQGPVCGACRAEFGDYLQLLPAPAETEPPPPESGTDTAHWRTLLRPPVPPPAAPPEERANQHCWMCEERRTCIRTEQGWECRTCRTIT